MRNQRKYNLYLCAGVMLLVFCTTALAIVPTHAHAAVTPGGGLTPSNLWEIFKGGLSGAFGGGVWAYSLGKSGLASALNHFFDLTLTVLSKVFYFVAYILATIGGLGVLVEGNIIGWLLYLSTGMINSPSVTSGFPIILQIANLGFVLALIVIAISTIIDYEPYGMKQTLRRLIMAALLANFSLYIAGILIQFSDNISIFFITNAAPTVGTTATSCGSNWTGFLCSASNFSHAIAGAFNPQTMFSLPRGGLTIDPANFAATLGGRAGELFIPFMSLFFVVIFLFVIIITMLAIIVGLLYRYVMISLLLIIMPVVWVLWIFPGLSSNWSKWWHEFIRWTFFPPLVIFFLYLAMVTSAKMSNNLDPKLNAGLYTNTTANAFYAGAASFTGGLVGVPLTAGLQMLVVTGLAFGGLIMANSLSIAGAKWAMGVAQGARGWVAGQAKDYAAKGGRLAYQRTNTAANQTRLGKRVLGGKELHEIMAASSIPGVSAVGRAIGPLVERGGKNLADQEYKNAMARYDSRTNARDLEGYMAPDKQFGKLRAQWENGDLEDLKGINKQDLSTFLKEKEGTFKDYGQMKLWYDLQNKGRGFNLEVGEAATELAATPATSPQFQPAMQKLDTAMQAYAANRSPIDIQKSQVGDLFANPNSERGRQIQRAFGIPDTATHERLMESFGNFAKAASQQTLSALLQKVAKGMSMDVLDRHMRTYVDRVRQDLTKKLARIPTKPEMMDAVFNSQNKGWITSDGARNLGITPENWGIT